MLTLWLDYVIGVSLLYSLGASNIAIKATYTLLRIPPKPSNNCYKPDHLFLYLWFLTSLVFTSFLILVLVSNMGDSGSHIELKGWIWCGKKYSLDWFNFDVQSKYIEKRFDYKYFDSIWWVKKAIIIVYFLISSVATI